jgi:hypothetical protein
MNLYHTQVERELHAWRKRLESRDGVISDTAKRVQIQTRKLIPRRVQNAITTAVKVFTETVMFSSRFISAFESSTAGLTLAESDYLAISRHRMYRAIAVGEGAATGAGGFLLGFADLPALLGVKLRFLFDCSQLYGYNVDDPEERLFILHVFRLAFSSREDRVECLRAIESWSSDAPHTIDWERFQLEYRDCLDTAKLLQLIPIIGAPIGAIANGALMDRLLETAMNAFRLRRRDA